MPHLQGMQVDELSIWPVGDPASTGSSVFLAPPLGAIGTVPNVGPRGRLMAKPDASLLLTPIPAWANRALILCLPPVSSFPCHFLGSNSKLLGSSFLLKLCV